MGEAGKHQLQELYERGCPLWESILDDQASKMSRALSAQGVKVTVKQRVKSLESLSEKQSKKKYQPGRGSELVKDLMGLRAVVPFLEDVETVVRVLSEEWTVVEVERKSDGLSFREFAYDAVHVILDLQAIAPDVEMPHGLPLVCEVQVRTYLQDAWAEVEHELIYKSSLSAPDQSIQKKLAALNASLALSDTVFQEIRDHQKRQVQWGQDRFQELRKKAARADSGLGSAPRASEAPMSSKDVRVLVEQHLNEGIAAHNDNEYERAEHCYSQALSYNPDLKTRSRVYNCRGMARFMQSQERAALADFDRAVKSNPRNHSALNNRGLAWRRMGVVLEALDDFEQSLEVKPGQAEVHFLRGQTLVEMGESPGPARNELESALRLDPSHSRARALLNSVAAEGGASPSGRAHSSFEI